MKGTQIKLTEEAVVGGNLAILSIISRQVGELIGGEPERWEWELGFDEIHGRVMLLKATR